MSNYSKEFLSQSNQGRAIPVTGINTSAPTLIHTTDNAGIKDEIWIYGSNTSNQDIFVSIYVGSSTGNTPAEVVFNGAIEAYAGNVLICPGFLVAGDENDVTSVVAVASVASGVNIVGYINRVG